MLPNSVVGWDIGGAHVKVALATTAESISKVCQLSCPLWLGIDQLHASMLIVQKNFDFSNTTHAITMTGELVDHFSNRKDGVVKLIKEIENNLQGVQISYFAGDKGFLSSDQAIDAHEEIASANWLASAKYIATRISDALFVDIGSTTSDIVRIKDHKAIFDGYSDAERLYARELVYCGVVRTPIFALCKSAPIKDRFIPVINECFANSADVYRLTNELPEYADMGETLDGRSKDVVSSATRLARMFGYDANIEELSIWQHVSEYIREQQLQLIINACRKQLSKFSQPLNIPIIGAGVGRFLIEEVAQRFNRQYIDFESLCKFKKANNEINIGDCAPAASVACLAYQRFYT